MLAQTFLSALLDPLSSGALPSIEWDALVPELRAQQLTPFVYVRLRASPRWRNVPLAVQRVLAEDFQGHSVRTYLMQAELTAIVAALDEAGVPVLLLKGAALGRLVYGSPAERPIGDIDLLIPAGGLEAARQALEQRQYEAQGLFWMARWQQRYRAELPMVCRALDRQNLLVELHWFLVELPYYIDRIPMAEIWQAATPAADLPGAMLPDPTTLLLHSCAHWALHHSQEQRLLWLLDIDRLARWDLLAWENVMERATRWRLQLAVRTYVEQAEARLGTPVPPLVKQTMAQWQPAPVETAMWGLGDERPGRSRQRIRTTWAALDGEQRWRYAAWLGLRGLLWEPEQLVRNHRSRKGSNSFAPVA